MYSSDTKSYKEIVPHSILYDMGNCSQLPVSYLTFKYKLLQQISDHFKRNFSGRARELTPKRLPRSKEETAVKGDVSYKPINHAWTEKKPHKDYEKRKRKTSLNNFRK